MHWVFVWVVFFSLSFLVPFFLGSLFIVHNSKFQPINTLIQSIHLYATRRRPRSQRLEGRLWAPWRWQTNKQDFQCDISNFMFCGLTLWVSRKTWRLWSLLWRRQRSRRCLYNMRVLHWDTRWRKRRKMLQRCKIHSHVSIHKTKA